MTYGGSNDDISDDVTWRWKVKVLMPKSLRPIISKTARIRASVTMGYLKEVESVASIGHVTDDVTDLEWLTSWPSYFWMQISRKRFEIEVDNDYPQIGNGLWQKEW